MIHQVDLTRLVEDAKKQADENLEAAIKPLEQITIEDFIAIASGKKFGA